MDKEIKTERKLLIIGLVLVLVGSLLATWIQSGKGMVDVQKVTFYGTYNGVYEAYLFVPHGLTTGDKAPGILATHGFNNSKEYMTNTALELSRRGFVVLAMDLDKHGLSESSNAPSVAENAYGAYDGLKYLRSLDIVDTENIGMIGMSMGGMAIEGAAKLMPDGYDSLFFMDSNCTDCMLLKNFAHSQGLGSETPPPYGAINGSTVATAPQAMEIWGTDEPIVEGQVYGSIADGTARVLYLHFGDHPYSTDDPKSIGDAIKWFGMTLEGEKGPDLPSSNQIWPLKVLGTFAGFAGIVIFMIGLGASLLRRPYFAALADTVPAFKGNVGAKWWIFAIITAFLAPVLLKPLFIKFFMANYFHLEGITTGFIGWLLVVGLITIALLVVTYFAFGKKNGVNLVSLGMGWEKIGLDWRKIGKSLVLALAVVSSAYAILYIINAIWLVDFRFWILTLKVTDVKHFFMMLAYVIPAAIYFVPLAVVVHGTLRPKNGKASFGHELLVNIIMLTIGIMVVLAYYYIPLEFFNAPSNLGPSALGLINGLALIIINPVIASISTYFYKKTGHVYVGAFINTLFIVWYLVACNTIFAFG